MGFNMNRYSADGITLCILFIIEDLNYRSKSLSFFFFFFFIFKFLIHYISTTFVGFGTVGLGQQVEGNGTAVFSRTDTTDNQSEDPRLHRHLLFFYVIVSCYPGYPRVGE